MQEEIYKDVVGFEKEYKISDNGKVVSKRRLKIIGGKTEYISNEIVLKQNKNTKGYFCVTLSKNGKIKKFQVHQLVAICFLNHEICGYEKVIDHKNNDKTDNRLENLQIISQRENASKNMSRGSSDFIGVYWYSPNKKWTAKILINKKRYYLGLFESEDLANLHYQEALNLKEFAGKVENFRVFIKNQILKKWQNN